MKREERTIYYFAKSTEQETIITNQVRHFGYSAQKIGNQDTFIPKSHQVIFNHRGVINAANVKRYEKEGALVVRYKDELHADLGFDNDVFNSIVELLGVAKRPLCSTAICLRLDNGKTGFYEIVTLTLLIAARKKLIKCNSFKQYYL